MARKHRSFRTTLAGNEGSLKTTMDMEASVLPDFVAKEERKHKENFHKAYFDNLLGEYDFSAEKLRDSVGIRLPKLGG